MRKPNCLIDTNIFLDVFLQREPFFDHSQRVLKLCEGGSLDGFLTASSITDIFYILKKELHDAEATYDALGAVLDIVGIIPVTGEDVIKAYSIKAPDFEDCLLSVCAKAFGCDCIITRNGKDFKGLPVKTMSPEEFLKSGKSFFSLA